MYCVVHGSFERCKTAEAEEASFKKANHERLYPNNDWEPVHQHDYHKRQKTKKYGPKPPIRNKK